MHGKGATFGLYTAESPTTCGGYPASAPDHEKIDAVCFVGVDYLSVDGCGPKYYKGGYKAMVEASSEWSKYCLFMLLACIYQWGNESIQPFNEFIMDGCNLWRNWHDINAIGNPFPPLLSLGIMAARSYRMLVLAIGMIWICF